MKTLRSLFFIALTVIGFSCSDDKDPEPKIEDATLSLSANSEVLEVPDKLLTSEDPNAQLAAGWITMANSMSSNLAMFTPPAGATKSDQLITPANGRVKAGNGIVYIWSDAQYGSVAYQIRDESDKYTFELFYKASGTTEWYRSVYAQELKDRSAGYMAVYDVWGSVSPSRDEELIRWEWTRAGDNFTFKMSTSDGEFDFAIMVNTKTKAGSAISYSGRVKTYEMTWDAQGSGTWKQYDPETGALTAEGSWV